MASRLLDTLTLGPRRRRRAMLRQLRELDAIDAGRRPGRARTAASRGLRSILLVGAVVGAMWWGLTQQLGFQIGPDGIRVPGALGTPAEAPDGDGGYVFARTQRFSEDTPVTYSPCDPIRVVVNDDLAPPGTEGVVAESLARVSELTGLRFDVEGSTDETPDSGTRSAREPVLIAWTTPDQVPELEDSVAGLGGSTSVRSSSGGPERYVSGQVALDAPQLAAFLDRQEGRALVRAVVMHELGHLVGLGHTSDPSQLMHSENIGRTDFGAGDRRGLALLGQGPC